MKKFEAYIIPGGEVEVQLTDTRETFLLESEKGHSFAFDLLDECSRQHPMMLRAVEQKIKQGNRTLFSMMQNNRALYATRMAYTICSCCFGERDDVPDFDGIRFRLERPKGCRDAKFCPWNGYLERNKDSFMVVCGAKREYGFTPTERRIVLLAQKGFVNPSVIAEVMGIAQKSAWNHLTSIYRKTGVEGMPELIIRIQYENI